MTAVSQHQSPLASVLSGSLSGKSLAPDATNAGSEGASSEGVSGAYSRAEDANFEVRLEQARSRQADSATPSAGQSEVNADAGRSNSDAVATGVQQGQAEAGSGAHSLDPTVMSQAHANVTARQVAGSSVIADEVELRIAGSEDSDQEELVDTVLPDGSSHVRLRAPLRAPLQLRLWGMRLRATLGKSVIWRTPRTRLPRSLVCRPACHPVCHPVCRLISGLIQPLPIRSPSSLASPPMLRRWPWPVVDFLTAAVMLTLRACLLLPWLHPLLWLVPGV